MTTRRGVLRLVVALAPALAVSAACGQSGQNAAYRHSSGLLVVTNDSLDRHPTEEAKSVVGFCDFLSDMFPDEIGFAYGVDDVATLGIATDRGQELYDRWRSDEGLPADARPDPEGKFIPSLNEQARALADRAVRVERVSRSRTQVEKLQNAMDFQDPAFAAAKIGGTHIDRPTTMVIIHMETLTDETASRLVQLYGTAEVAVLLEPYQPATAQ